MKKREKLKGKSGEVFINSQNYNYKIFKFQRKDFKITKWRKLSATQVYFPLNFHENPFKHLSL